VVRTTQHHTTHAHHEKWHVCTHKRVCHAVMQRAERGQEMRITRRVESLGKSTTHTTQTMLEITQTTHTTRKRRQHARTAIAANGGAYAHSGSMHQDGRRCMEVGTSNKWYTETAAKQPGAHPPELPQKPRNAPHHHRGTPAGTPAKTQKSTSSPPWPIPDGKAMHIVCSGAASTARAAQPNAVHQPAVGNDG
jgi:hypothetical protein